MISLKATFLVLGTSVALFSGATGHANLIAANEDSTCAIHEGAVFCWGSNLDGQLNVDSEELLKCVPPHYMGIQEKVSCAPNPALVQLTTKARATAVSVNATNKCGIFDGLVICWGQLHYEAKKEPTPPKKNYEDFFDITHGPEVVAMLVNRRPIENAQVTALASGGADNNCAGRTGMVSCWRFAPGLKTTTEIKGLPENVPLLELSVGSSEGCARYEDQSVWCWNLVEATPAAKIIESGSGVTSISVFMQSVAVVANGKIKFMPRPGGDPIGPRFPETTFLSIHLGYTGGCAVSTDGALWCWGANSEGQLGNATTSPFLPVSKVLNIGGSGGVTSVAMGGQHACALENGKTYCWGANSLGQLGTGFLRSKTTPTEVLNFSSDNGE